MTLLKILQQNAEWMCAIAITIFAGVQCYITHQQNIQSIKLKRLELANNLDEIAAKFLGEVSNAKNIRQWLVSNASNFAFLLNQKDLEKYKIMCGFILNYINKPATTSENKIKAIADFTNILSELDAVLGNANYGIVKNNKDFMSVKQEVK